MDFDDDEVTQVSNDNVLKAIVELNAGDYVRICDTNEELRHLRENQQTCTDRCRVCLLREIVIVRKLGGIEVTEMRERTLIAAWLRKLASEEVRSDVKHAFILAAQSIEKGSFLK